MRPFTLAHQTMFADLTQRAHDAGFDEQFPEGGNFVRHRRGEREFWYYVPSSRDDARRKHMYVGRCGNADVERRVAAFRSAKAGHTERRALVAALRSAGLPVADALSARVLDAMSRAGVFRLGGVLVGTVAFQTYPGLLGVRLDGSALMTGDIDVAQFQSVAVAVNDTTRPMADILAEVDPSFRAIPHLSARTLAATFVNDAGFRVEFITPNRGSDRHQGRLTRLDSFPGVGAEPLRFLDFLIHDAVPSVVLRGGGVPVTVPSPERYAIHKMIVSTQRRDAPAKRVKDVRQAASLIEAMTIGERGPIDIGLTWMEARSRGRGWFQPLDRARLELPAPIREALDRAVVLASDLVAARAGTDH